MQAQAVANTLDAADIDVESVVPHPARIRTVAENVATAVVLRAQADGLAEKTIGDSRDEVAAKLKTATCGRRPRRRMPRRPSSNDRRTWAASTSTEGAAACRAARAGGVPVLIFLKRDVDTGELLPRAPSSSACRRGSP